LTFIAIYIFFTPPYKNILLERACFSAEAKPPHGGLASATCMLLKKHLKNKKISKNPIIKI